MASPQIEKGFTKIANEIMEALAGIRISGEARQCLDVIIRKTYGFNKKDDHIALSQFCLLTKMSKVLVCRSLLKLVKMNLIISKKANGNITLYRFNKDFDTWKPLAKKLIISKNANAISKNANNSLAKMLHTKETIQKKLYTKETSEQSSQVKQVMDIFYKTNPTLNFGNKTIRKACIDLINLMGIEKALEVSAFAVSVQNKQFYPVITNPYQLWIRLSDLKIAYERDKNGGAINLDNYL